MKRYLALSVFLATRLLAQTQGGFAPQPGAAQTDYLARLLHQGDLGWTTILIGMIVALCGVPVMSVTLSAAAVPSNEPANDISLTEYIDSEPPSGKGVG